MSLDPGIATLLKRNADGLVPAVVQDATSREVLMLAWMNDEALSRTLTTRRGTYWSRSRQQYWVKGETSGNPQHVREVRIDCDCDTLLVLVEQCADRTDVQPAEPSSRARPVPESDDAPGVSSPQSRPAASRHDAALSTPTAP